MNICNTGDCNNRTKAGFCYFFFAKSVKFVEFADFYAFFLIRIMMV